MVISVCVTTTTEPLTVDDVLDYIGFGKFQWTISFICGLAWAGDAMEVIILTILSSQLHCEWRLRSYQMALMSSVVFLAVGIGCPVWGIFCDKYGRKIGLTISLCSVLYFGLLSTFAPMYSWLLFLRFLVGFGISGSPQAYVPIPISPFLISCKMCLCASAVLGFWLHVRDPVGAADYAHPGLEVAAAAVRPPSRVFSYFQPQPLTVDDVLDYIGFGKFQWTISFICGLAWAGDAMEVIILTILSSQLHCEWRLRSYQMALMSSVVFLAVGIGCPVWGIFCDKYGRKIGLTISLCSVLYFGLLSTFAPMYSWLLFLRFLVGFGISGSPQALTLYSEFLPVSLRGRCLALLELFWAFGSMFEILLALLIMPTLGWRWLLRLSALPVGFFLIFSHWLPESPRFDILSGRTAKAVKTLLYIAKQNRRPMPEATIVAFKEDHRGQIKDLFTPQLRKTTVLLSFIWISAAFCYYGIILLTPDLLQSVKSWGSAKAQDEPVCGLECKYLTSDDYEKMLWTSFAEIPGPILLALLLDHFGRKKSMAFGFLMFSLFLLPMYWYAFLGSPSITSLILITRAFSVTSLQLCYIYGSEVFPTKTRALGIGFCAGIGKVGSLISPFVSEVISGISLHLTLSIYCGCGLLAAVASLMLPIETLGKDLGTTTTKTSK
uniref:SV2 related protein b n=1 Tax=Tetraodon nigroviridis TaxID=99883 RepID=H3CUJ7_TETNG